MSVLRALALGSPLTRALTESAPAPIVGARPRTAAMVGADVTMNPWLVAYDVLSVVGSTTGAYHGYKRNDSAGWAFGWFLFGGIAPVFSIPLSLAQGFAKPARK